MTLRGNVISVYDEKRGSGICESDWGLMYSADTLQIRINIFTM